MEHVSHEFLFNLAMVLGVAALTTVLFQALHQPVVLGYLLAGLIVGPHTPIPLVADEKTIHTLSELGVILLMFSLGLEFSLSRLFQVLGTAGLVAVIQCSLMIWLGYIVGQMFGWTAMESFFTGALLAISSTTIIVKAFDEYGQASKRLVELVFGVLIVEDLIAILLLAMLTASASGAKMSADEVVWTVARLVAFLVALVGVGLLIVPRAFRQIAALRRPETMLVASVGFCFTIALLAQWAGYSVALGAFLAGALVAESGRAHEIEHLVRPVRDMFAAIFFVAVGMLLDPALIAAHWLAVVVLTVVVVLGKFIGVAVGAFLTGYSIRTSVQAGMSLAQIGEFSFIIAGVGLALGATDTFLYPVAVAVSAITTLLTPWLIRASTPVAEFIDRRLPKPLQTFAALYGSWLEQFRATPHEPSMWQRLRRLIGLLLIDAGLLGGVLIGSALAMQHSQAWIQDRFAAPDYVARIVVIVTCILVSAPFCFGIARCAQSLGKLLATEALPAAAAGKLDLAAAPRQALVLTFQLAIVLLVGVPLVAVTQPFLPPFGGAALLAAVLCVMILGFLRSAAQFQGHVRAGSQMIAEFLSQHAPASTDGAKDDALATLDRLLPGMGTPTAVRLEAGSPAVGKSLRQLNLRGLTAATVLAIARGNEGILPTGKEELMEGDVLALAGTHESIAAARQLLLPSAATAS
ncbi:MAG: cation:proton antiporter [Planctomycetes bacterium]|nr:cation:proton antiporter [Planctomycetota bacterium]